jgi:hypothetical protein
LGAGRTYHVYGLQLDSAWPLPYPEKGAPCLARVSLQRASAKRFVDALGDTHVSEFGAWASAALPDGSRYLRWSTVFEFLIQPDGHSVLCRPMYDGAVEAFHTHLGPSLSFAIINLGIEPLHSTTVMVDGGAVALMGDCGYGKSSLGATFVRAGHALLTDDLLVLKRQPEGFVAYPGAPRVKLYPEIAKKILGPRVRGLRLTRHTPKIIIPLAGARAQQTPAPLKAIYMLTPPVSRHTRQGVTIRRLAPRRAFLEVVRSTFNMAVTDPDRLERQFRLASDVALTVPVKMLSYPRKLSMLAAARDAILRDLQG